MSNKVEVPDHVWDAVSKAISQAAVVIAVGSPNAEQHVTNLIEHAVEVAVAAALKEG